ncbi:MAG: glycosyltransferase family 4 protein [Ekhidna sp.]
MQNKNRVLYLTYDGLTDPLGQSQIIPYLAGLSNLGHDITILSAEKSERFDQKKELIKDILTKSGIKWEPVIYHKKPPIISTLFDLYRLKRKAHSIAKNNSLDIVHCRSYLSSIIGLSLKRKYGLKFIFDMRGFWADERVDGKLWNLRNPLFKWIFKYFKGKEKTFLTESDAIISLTQAGKEEMIKWVDSSRFMDKISIIPCCVDTSLFDPGTIDPQKLEEKREELNIHHGDFILTYLGSIGTWYMLPEMLNFFKSLKKVNENAVMLFITPKSDHNRIYAEIQNQQLPLSYFRVIESGRNNVPTYLSLSNYSIFFITPSYSKLSSSPTKQAEIMALGIPVICNEGVGDTSFIVSRYESGITLSQLNKDCFEKAVRAITETTFDPEQLRRGALEYFDLSKGVASYHKIYNSLKIK